VRPLDYFGGCRPGVFCGGGLVALVALVEVAAGMGKAPRLVFLLVRGLRGVLPWCGPGGLG